MMFYLNVAHFCQLRAIAVILAIFSSLGTLCWCADEEIFFPDLSIHFQSKSWQISAFYLDKFEVTNRDFLDFAAQSDLKPMLFAELSKKPNFLDLPIVGVDWYDANLYCQFRGQRLPSYLELVRASQGEFPRDYPFSIDFPELFTAPFITHAHRPNSTYPVNSFAELQSDEGVFNLAGNVAEWTADWSDEELKEWKMVYGGSYLSDYQEVRVGSFRPVRPEENTSKSIGFRCARDGSGFDISGGNLDIEELKQLVYDGGGEVQKNLFLEIKQIEVQQVREREEERDQEKRLAYLQYLSRLEWQRRLSLVRNIRLDAEQPVLLGESPMIGIPHGYFFMGDNDIVNASPRHLVFTDKFDIQKRPVLKEEIRAFLEQRPVVRASMPSSSTGTDEQSLTGEEAVPEEWFTSDDFALVSHQNARTYCQSIGMDLPTEAQWEKSVRGITKDSLITVERGWGVGYYGVIAVGIGNSEWLRDKFGPYQLEKTDNGLLHAKNPWRQYGFFPLVKGQGTLLGFFTRISDRRIGLPISSHSFRCVKEFDGEDEVDFDINPEWNYLSEDFIKAIESDIEKGVNVFNLSWTEKSFEKWSRQTYND